MYLISVLLDYFVCVRGVQLTFVGYRSIKHVSINVYTSGKNIAMVNWGCGISEFIHISNNYLTNNWLST